MERHPHVRRAVAVLATVTALSCASVSMAPGIDPGLDPGLDSDGDGLPDIVESRGWATADGRVHVTDPHREDSDGDGLPDRWEAGAAVLPGVWSTSYVGWTDPNLADSDGDGLSDGEEDTWGSDPLKADSDDDGLHDGAEEEFGSDPLTPDTDGDGRNDAREHADGSDPLTYDLSRTAAVAALTAGIAFGDCVWCARTARLNDAQQESWQYAVGQVLGGFVAVGDVRDVVVALASGELSDAGLAAIGIAPGHGDLVRMGAVLKKFAATSPRGMAAARAAITKLPAPASVKKAVTREVFGSDHPLPHALGGGKAVFVFYVGVRGRDVVYCGISQDFDQRRAQHAARNFVPVPVVRDLTRGAARALEQACIVRGRARTDRPALENRVNSITPQHAHHDDAVAYGADQLRGANEWALEGTVPASLAARMTEPAGAS